MINPVKSQAFFNYTIQLVCQVWFHIFKLVTSQPMFQVFTQELDQAMGLLVFQYLILASNLVYCSHKPHLILPVSISVPSPVGIHQPPSAHTSIGFSIQREAFTVTKFCVYYCYNYSSK